MVSLTLRTAADALFDGSNGPAIERSLVDRFLRSHPTVSDAGELIGCDSFPGDLIGRFDDVELPTGRIAAAMQVADAFAVISGGRQDRAAVFTPERTARRLADLALPDASAPSRVADPACGAGVLLLAALERLTLASVPAASAVSRFVFGDVDRDSVRRTRGLLALAADTADVPAGHVGDALSLTVTQVGGKVDAVVCNPPYIRYQAMPVQLRAQLRDQFEVCATGNSNLYFAFFELAVRLLGPDGHAAFITPSSHHQSAAGKPLRALLSRHVTAVFDNSDEQVFDDASVYTCITQLAGTAQTSPVATSSGATPRAAMTAGPWLLTTAPLHDAVDAILSAPCAFSDVARLQGGVATLRDRLYLADDTPDGVLVRHGGRTFPIERDATRPCIRVGALGPDAQRARTTHRILFPYVRRDGRTVAMTEDELSDRFPLAFAYLTHVRDLLAERDRGRKSYEQWFAYGRRQGLDVSEKARLVSPLYAARPRFLPVDDVSALHIGGVSVAPTSDLVDVVVLDRLCNSQVMRLFVEQTSNVISGGYRSYQKSRLARLRLPSLDASRCLQLREASTSRADELLWSWYGLDDDLLAQARKGQSVS